MVRASMGPTLRFRRDVRPRESFIASSFGERGVVMAREYLIEIDVIEGHKPLTGADVPASALKPYGWRSIGAKGPTGSKYKGGTFTNKSGETIVAMRLKANK